MFLKKLSAERIVWFVKEENEIVCGIYRQKRTFLKKAKMACIVSTNLSIFSSQTWQNFNHTFSSSCSCLYFLLLLFVMNFISWLGINCKAICISIFSAFLLYLSCHSFKVQVEQVKIKHIMWKKCRSIRSNNIL